MSHLVLTLTYPRILAHMYHTDGIELGLFVVVVSSSVSKAYRGDYALCYMAYDHAVPYNASCSTREID